MVLITDKFKPFLAKLTSNFYVEITKVANGLSYCITHSCSS